MKFLRNAQAVGHARQEAVCFAHKENWYALYLAIERGMLADKALSLMGVKAEQTREPKDTLSKQYAECLYFMRKVCGISLKEICQTMHVKQFVIYEGRKYLKAQAKEVCYE